MMNLNGTVCIEMRCTASIITKYGPMLWVCFYIHDASQTILCYVMAYKWCEKWPQDAIIIFNND